MALRALSAELGPALEGTMADLVLRPWFDRVALHAIVHWYFPLSRAWAAAIEAPDLDAFLASVGPVRVPLAQAARAVAFAAERQRRYEEAAAAWQEAFFGRSSSLTGAERAAIEETRLRRAHAAMAARSAFVPLHLARRFPAIRWEIASAETVEARHGDRFGDPFPAPPAAAIELSHEMPSAGERVHWLRFPSGTDIAWARVARPEAASDPPTLIFLHGIAMETEFWRGEARMMLRGLVEAGVRIVQPEGPWHGRRRKPGWFGGEPAMAQGPLGMLDLFDQWVAETAQLVAWARATSRGRVALGGVSLGALTSQLAGVAAARWPEPMRPDALFLVATSGDVLDAVLEGRLAQALGAPAQLAAAGWTAPRLERWRPLVDPVGAPALDPHRIVMVLGAEDVVTPFKGGSTLARRWGVPRRNVFVRPQGHFSVALGLTRRADPLRRLLEILRQA
jgi:hypothetical protein